MRKPIPYGRQDINQDDINAVIEVLKSDFLTQGPAVPVFERAVSSHCGSEYAVAVNSATSALHIACLALGVGKGDLVWTSAITFVASANCALYTGAEIDFVDIDPQTYNLCPLALAVKLEQAERNGRLPRVVIPVHLCGQPCEMDKIYALSQRYGFKIIEDASHAIGGKYKSEPIGNCRYSDITVFSFHPVKIITTAEGGMALTNNTHLANRMNILRSHGITREPSQMTRASEGSWYYQQIDLGFNYRMTEMQAMLGVSQINRLDRYVTRRHELATRYSNQLVDLPLILPWQHKDSYSAFHLFVIRLQLRQIGKTHQQVFDEMREQGIGVNLHYIPVYHHPYFEKMNFKVGYCSEAEKYYSEAISIPMYPGLTTEDQDFVIRCLRRAIFA